VRDWDRAQFENEPGGELASSSVELTASGQTARKVMNPWILLKVKALGELIPKAGIDLERMLDQGGEPAEISSRLRVAYGVRLSELEVGRYGSWLPEIRRDAMRKAEARSERMVQEVRRREKVEQR
jgi:hypothetical protein